MRVFVRPQLLSPDHHDVPAGAIGVNAGQLRSPALLELLLHPKLAVCLPALGLPVVSRAKLFEWRRVEIRVIIHFRFESSFTLLAAPRESAIGSD